MNATQVLIIGAGPVGLISALTLAQSNINCLLVDRRETTLDAPKAHAVNARTLEICQRLGLDADEIRRAGASIEDGGQVHFVDTLSSTCFGSLPYERQDDGALEFTPWPLVNIAQPKFEMFLQAQVNDYPCITFQRGVTASDLRQSDTGVTATLTDTDGNTLEHHAEYVIAADGANSRIREALDIGMTGPEALQSNMMIHFEADLRSLTENHPGLLYFTLAPDARGVFIGYQRDRTWVFMQSFDPNTQSRDDFDDARCQDLVQAAAGSPLPDLQIKNVSPWTMSAQVADSYRSGRVFLAGDAAHRFPPTGGLGLNTGVADAENIAWKLSKVLLDKAPAELLDSYEAERRPISQINTQQSLANSAKMMFLFSALYGPEPAEAAEHYAKVLADPDAHPALAQAVEVQRPHFDSFNLQIGYRYGETVDPDSIDISHYVPRFEPGDHLPLLPTKGSPWLLGLVPNNEFALIAGHEGESWRNDVVPVLIDGADFEGRQPFHEWAGLTSSGALLIRPDGHIAARWIEAPTDTACAVEAAHQKALTGQWGN